MSKDIQKWKVKGLKPHSRQSQLFPDLPYHLLRDLAQDIAGRGLKDPLEILPDGTIVCGHQRTRAAMMLGWEEIDVWVNHELDAQGDLAVEQRLIEDNLVGRKLHRLDQVRCYQRLGEMAPQTPDERVRSHQCGRLRDVIGTRLGMSGRTLERYLRVLEAPTEVQNEFRAGRISLVNASKIAGLSEDVQQQIVADIRAGADAAEAVRSRLASRAPDPLDAVLGSFIRSLQRNVRAVRGYASQIHSLSPFDTIILEDAHSLIGQILRQIGTDEPQRGRKAPRKRQP